jgi:subtilisin family serine protease
VQFVNMHACTLVQLIAYCFYVLCELHGYVGAGMADVLLSPPAAAAAASELIRQGENPTNGLRRIDALTSNQVPVSNANVAVAIVDTGIDGSHPDLCVAGGQAFLTNEPDGDALTDTVGHGTHVAGG